MRIPGSSHPLALLTALGLAVFWSAVAASPGSGVRDARRNWPPAQPAQEMGQVKGYLPLLLLATGRDELLPPPTAVPATATLTPLPSATPTVATVEPTVTPTFTASPIPPSQTPTSTATPTPTPTVALTCNEALPNGNFEQGATIWELTVGSQKEHPSQAIKRAEAFGVPAKEGDYIALSGGVLSALIDLRNGRVAGVDATRLHSVTLRFYLFMVTNERPNGRPNDEFEARLEIDDREFLIEDTRQSEESLEAQRWVPIEADVTDLFRRRGRKEFIFRSRHDDQNGTFFFIDAATLTACVTP